MLTSSQPHPPKTNHTSTSYPDESHIHSGRVTHTLRTSHTSTQDESHIHSGRVTHTLKTSHTSPQDKSHIPSGLIIHSKLFYTSSTVLPVQHTSLSTSSQKLDHSSAWTRRRAQFAVQPAQRHSDEFQAASLSKTNSEHRFPAPSSKFCQI